MHAKQHPDSGEAGEIKRSLAFGGFEKGTEEVIMRTLVSGVISTVPQLEGLAKNVMDKRRRL
jgi:hypothetical protein